MRNSSWSILYITTLMLILPPVSVSTSGTRAKRVVAFRKGSTFFYRLNYKIAAIPTSTIFAQATGFKVAWKLPYSNMEKRKRRNVDEIHESVALAYESHGFDGEACVAKNICQALEYANGKDGVMAKIFRLLGKKMDGNATILAFDQLACKAQALRCPLELVGVNKFIEDSQLI